MIDRDRLIEAWEIFRDSNPYGICGDREFRAMREPDYCMGQMIEDTIALLRKDKERTLTLIDETIKEEQEAVKPILCHARRSIEPYQMTFWYECGSCGAEIKMDDDYCNKCGKLVKW